MKKVNRIYFIDELRGFCVLCMVFFHAFFTVGYIFDIEKAQFLFNFFTPIEPLFALSFIIISGICSHLSHNNLLRGFKLLFIAIALNLVTIFFLPGCEIYFGILNLLSICMILFHFTSKAINKIPFFLGISVFAVLFFLTYSLPHKFLGIQNVLSVQLPQKLYTTDYLFFLGFPNDSFYSADYFPLMPWAFAFYVGVFLGKYARTNKFPQFMYKSRIKPFSFLGKYALIIYIVHQPLIYGITYLIYAIVK